MTTELQNTTKAPTVIETVTTKLGNIGKRLMCSWTAKALESDQQTADGVIKHVLSNSLFSDLTANIRKNAGYLRENCGSEYTAIADRAERAIKTAGENS